MKAEIYSKTTCPYCVKAKALLTQNKIDYTEFLLDKGQATKEDIEKRLGSPIRTVPQIWLNGEYVGGFTDLQAKLNNI